MDFNEFRWSERKSEIDSFEIGKGSLAKSNGTVNLYGTGMVKKSAEVLKKSKQLTIRTEIRGSEHLLGMGGTDELCDWSARQIKESQNSATSLLLAVTLRTRNKP